MTAVTRLEVLARRLQERGLPVADRRFWLVQTLVVGIAVVDIVVDAAPRAAEQSILYMLPELSFLIPVGYAALSFGLRGAVCTALWATALTFFHVLGMHHLAQMDIALVDLVVLNATAVFVGQRVDREAAAAAAAERARVALQASERRYRTLFDSSGEAVLVLDRSGVIQQANAAASELLGRPRTALAGETLRDLLGRDSTTHIQGEPPVPSEGELVLTRPGGAAAYLEPIPTVLTSEDGPTLVQLVLRDVTHQRRRREELRSYAGHTLRAQEDERRRIAQELHDDVLQSLILLVRHLDAIEESFGASPAVALARLQATRAVAEDLVRSVRGFAYQLRPPTLEALGLVASLRQGLDEMASRAGLESEFIVEGPPRRLADDVELGLFRIAQEALRNVERHAAATAVVVTVRFAENGVMLQVEDNGAGFDAEGEQPRLAERRHFGLLGMQERAALVGGRLSIASRPGGGTTVITTVPDATGTSPA